MLPRVSVIIAAYNEASGHLAEAIRSVLSQTFTDIELILVDDGSTDHTSDLATGFGEALRYKWRPNGGLAAARNTGIKEARGDYIAFLDADDLFLPHRLASQVPLLDENPDLGLVYGQAVVFGEGRQDEHLLPETQKLVAGNIFESLYFENVIPVLTVLTRRSILEELGGFDENTPATEDWELWLRIAARFPVAFVPEPLARYRVHDANMSGNLTLMLGSEISALTLATQKNPDRVRPFQSRARAHLAGKHARFARHLQKIGRGAEAHEQYSEAIRMGHRTPKAMLNWLLTRASS
jgi:glycosyltransferase involved in cell wall biosynthesis